MGVLNEQANGCRGMYNSKRIRHFWMLPVLVLILMVVGRPLSGWALQQHTLIPEEGTAAGAPKGDQQAVTPPASEGHGAPGTKQQVQQPQGLHATEPATKPSSGLSGGTHGAAGTGLGHEVEQGGHEAAPGHGGKTEAHGIHGPALPEVSPIAGVTFVETMINLMERELNGRFLGWRPNDIVFGRFTDNINNFQLGVLEAIRFTTLRLKDSLTRMGDADAYDPDLEKALNLFMNSSTKWWFPSAESSYGEALDHLKKFVVKLKTNKRSFYYRKDNLVLLLSSYRDLLGNVNRTLIAPKSWFEIDDAFYYAKGVAHVYYEILRVVRVGFQNQLTSTLYAQEILDEILHELSRTEEIDPWIVLDSDLGSLFANHRANLNAPLSEVTHLLVVLSQL